MRKVTLRPVIVDGKPSFASPKAIKGLKALGVEVKFFPKKLEKALKNITPR